MGKPKWLVLQNRTAAPLAVVATALPVQAQTQTPVQLVSTIEQTNTGSNPGPFDRYDAAQAFTTGTDTNGYKLTSVGLRLYVVAGTSGWVYSVSVWSATATGSPDTSLVTLTNPALATGTTAFANYTFTESGNGIDLDASTTYVIVVDVTTRGTGTNTFSMSNTVSDDEDTVKATGWSIADGSHYRDWDSTGAWTTFDQTRRIRVTGTPNNPPTSAEQLVDADEDTDYTFTADDFGFADTDAGDSLASVKIVTLPASGEGTLTLSGTAIGSGDLPQTVTAAQLGNLKYSPPANLYGKDVASFTFKVNDGTVDSDNAYTMTIDVIGMDDPVTGKPGITGTAQVDQTLTATVGTIADVDGVPDPFISAAATTVQWIQVDGVNETDISGADSSTYTLVDADLGKTIKVKVSFEDEDGTVEGPLTSDAYPSSGTVMAAGGTNTAPTAADNTVTTAQGTAYTFTADDFSFDDTDTGDTLASVRIVTVPAPGALALDGTAVTADDVVTKAQIDGSMLTFTPVAGASGTGYASFTFKVNDGTVDSADTYTMNIDVAAMNDDAATGKPGITGTAQVGWTLTATVGTIADVDGLPVAGVPDPFFSAATTTVQWIQVDGVNESDISGATSETYTLVTADAGKKIKVKVSFEDEGGTNEGPLTSDAYPSIGTVQASGTPVSGVLVSNVGQGGSHYTSLSRDDLAQRFTTGTNATGYTLTSIELTLNSSDSTDTPTVKLYSGSATGTEEATFTGPAMLDASSVKNYAFTPSSTVTLRRSTTYWVVAEGDTGWETTISSEDETPAIGWGIGDRADFRAASATGPFGPTLAQSPLKIRVNGTFGGYVLSSDATLSALALEDASDDSAIDISPTFASGTTSYTASVDNDVDGITIEPTVNESSATVEYLDSSDTEIADADAVKTGQQVSLFVGANTIKVKVTAQDTTTTNPYTVVVTRAANTAPTSADERVEADEDFDYTFSSDDFAFTDTDTGDSLASVKIVTLPASGTLTLSGTAIGSGDLPKTVLAAEIDELKYSPPANLYGTDVASFTFKVNDGTVDSDNAYTITIDVKGEDDSATGAPTITGTAQVGETLTAVTTGIMDADGLTSPTYTYQWIRANGTEADIASANSSTYILVAADLGKTIKVKVSFEDDDSNPETLTSAATATVVAAPMVTDVDVTSTPAALTDTYGTGEMIQFTVTFDQSVTVTGTPEFEFCLGTTSTMSCDVGTTTPARRRAALSSGTGTTALVFGYTVVVGDVDDDGIWIGDQSRTIKLETGDTIQGTVGGLDAVLTHEEKGALSGHKVNGAAANTAPTAANNTVTTAEDRAYTFMAADFGFMDADAGAALASVKIVTPPALGTLALDGTAVVALDDVTKAQIDGDMLTFRPALNADGDAYTTFTFKVNDGTDDSTSAYTMTIDVTDSPAPVCTAPSFGDRREIWSGTVTVGALLSVGVTEGYGFLDAESFGELDLKEFDIGSNNHSIDAIGASIGGRLFFALGGIVSLTATETAALRLHVCDGDYDFSTATPAVDNMVTFHWTTATLDWSPPVVTRTLYLSLPANHVATGEPAISGTAQAGQELTADATPIMDTDGLTDVDFTYQWIRVDADGTSNEEDITGEIAATYTLPDDDEGKKIKVKVSFTDELSGVEERTSAAYPSSGTVTAAASTNTAPVFSSSNVSREIAENTAAGQNVGAAVTATDADAGDTLGYELGGADAASFDIVGTSGQIRTKTNVSYDFEAKSSYTVTVTASDGTDSAVATVTISVTDADEPPDAPSAISVTAVTDSSTSLTVSWTAPANDGKPDIESYDVQYRLSGATAWTDGPEDVTGTTTTVSGLTADTEYQVQVRAANDEGESDWSDPPGSGQTNIIMLSTNAPPTAADKTVTTTLNRNYTFLTTDFGFEDADSGAALASVKIVTLPAVGNLALDGTDVTLNQVVTRAEIDAANLKFEPATDASGTGYASFHFKVNDGTDDSVSAYTMTINVMIVTAPGAPSALTATASGQAWIELAWTAPVHVGGRAITGYRIEVSPDGASDWTELVANTASTATTYVHKGLNAGATRHYRVSAINVVGASDPSGSDHATTRTDEQLVSNFNYAGDADNVHLSAQNVVGIFTTGSRDAKLNSIELKLRKFNNRTVAPALKLHVLNRVGGRATLGAEVATLATPATSLTADSFRTFNYQAPSGTSLTASEEYIFVLEPPTIGIILVETTTDPSEDDVKADGWTIDGSGEGFEPFYIGSTRQIVFRVNGTQTPNTAPTAADNTVTMAEDGRYEFSATDFGFHDTNPADRLVSVRIETLPALGALALDGADVTLNQVVTKTQIDAGDLTFRPAAGGSGNNYARFNFKVNDGTVFSASAYTMRIDVTPTPPLTGQIFVDNTAETDYLRTVADNRSSQSFTTGPNRGGYILTSIGVVAQIVGENGVDDFSVAVHNADANGAPVALHTSLIPPGNFPEEVSTIHFHAPSNTRLRPNTTYSIVLGSGRTPSRFRQISATQSNADNASGSGWSIGDALHSRRSAASPWSSPNDGRSVKIVIRGNTASGVANNAPVFSPATVDRSIAENTAAGRNVGAVVTATDADNDPLTYTLGGANMASFDIDEFSGQIRTRAGVSYDHEAKPSYTVTVTASDGIATADADVTISVTDVNEPPRAPATPVVSAVAGSNTSLTVTWAAPANAGRPAIDSYDVQYRASGATDWIDGPDHSTTTAVTGLVAYTLHAARVTGLIANTEYEARVRAVNDEGNSGWSTPPGAGRTNTLTNNAPVFSPAIVGRSIAENTAADVDIGLPVTATDDDAGDTLGYTLGGAGAEFFDFVEASGQIRTKADVSYDFEARSSYTVTVTASDGTVSAAAIVTISVIDVAEPPDAPATPEVTPVTGSTTSLAVSWAAPDNDGRPAIDGYDVQYRVGGSGTWTDVPQVVTGTTATITGLTAATDYQVQVRAANAEGDSGWSDPTR